MKPYVLLVLACALVGAVGCGPLKMPMPQRFDPEVQKQIDESWNQAFTPPDKLGHQDLLDVLVGTQAYQLGVDTFTFRAEKRFVGGKVVMEVWFDRAKPDDDRFEVSVFDLAGKLVRTERFSRQEVETTYDALFVVPGENVRKPEPPEWAARRAHQQKRLEKIRIFFPEFKAPGPDTAPQPNARN